MKNRMTLSKAASMVSSCKSSGLTVKSYCLKEKIHIHVYYYWLSRLQTMEPQEAGNIYPVIIEKPGQEKRTIDLNLELTYPNGVKVSVPVGCGTSLLRELIHIL
jgi:hypothetical protein